MLEVGGKPIIQYNFERLSQFGISNIIIALRYLGEQFPIIIKMDLILVANYLMLQN